MYLTHGVNLWFYLLGTGKVGFDSSIVEIGCGCGRRTHLLRDFETNGVRFNGQYLGIDIDNELLEWCRRNFDPERFDFFQSPHGSSAYRGAEVKTELRIPRDDNSTDLVFGTSVLTHLLEPEMSEYFSEASRILRPGRCLVMTCKCIDRNVKTFGNTYPHRIGNAYVQSSSTPEAAVAYESEFLLSFIKERGFSNAEILVGDGDIQHLLIATK
jgi:SAM-dependent methyltransferase